MDAALTVAKSADAGGAIATWREEVTSHGHSSRPGRNPSPTLLAVEYMDPPRQIPNAMNPPLASGGGAQRNAVPAYRIPKLTVGVKRKLLRLWPGAGETPSGSR